MMELVLSLLFVGVVVLDSFQLYDTWVKWEAGEASKLSLFWDALMLISVTYLAIYFGIQGVSWLL